MQRHPTPYAIHSAFCIVFAAFAASAATIRYVKPGGTGAGTSWADAADLESAVTAAAAASGKTDLYLAQGVYYPAATVRLTDGVSLYGGFAGLSDAETPETRDIAATPSIISGDVNRDDYWAKYNGNTGASSNLRDSPIIVDGEISVPANLGDFVTVVPAPGSIQDNLMRLLVVAEDATSTLDGITLQGGGRGDTGDSTKEDGYQRSFGATLLVTDGAKATIRNCRVVGAAAWESPIWFGGTAAKPSTNFVFGLSVENCRGARTGAFRLNSYSATTLTNCSFIGNARFSHVGGWQTVDAAAALTAGNLCKIHDCLFEGNVNFNQFDGGYVRSAAVLCLPYCGALRSSEEVLRGLVFRGNASHAEKKQPFPLVLLGIDNYKLNEFIMHDNLIKSESSDPLVASLVDSSSYDGGWRKFTIMNSTIYSNTISVAAGSGTNVLFAAPVLARGLGQLVNCTFYDNVTTVTAPEGVDVYAARGVIGTKLPGADPSKQWCASCFNCVFAGSTPLPDVLDAGDENGQVCSFVANSILWATGEAASTPRVAVSAPHGADAGNAVEVGNCIVKGLSLLGPRVTLLGTVTESKPGLGALGFLDGDDPVPVMQCRARKADLRHSYDIKHWDYYTQDVYCYFQGGSTTGGLTRDGRGVAARATYIGDALGEARPAGAFTLGAVQDVAGGYGFMMKVK